MLEPIAKSLLPRSSLLLKGRPSCCLEMQANDQKANPKPGDPARSDSHLPEVPYLLLVPALWFIWFAKDGQGIWINRKTKALPFDEDVLSQG